MFSQGLVCHLKPLGNGLMWIRETILMLTSWLMGVQNRNVSLRGCPSPLPSHNLGDLPCMEEEEGE
uniref:Uncharacterized protein n=1 Tax=Arundo donax TaxID=35708 RepID=A0A0A9FKB0_ARUDO